MVEEFAFLIAQKRIAVIEQAYAFHLLGHGGVVKLDPDHADKPAPPIDRDIIGDHAHIQVFCDVRGNPDRLAHILRDGEPYQFGGIRRVIERDIRHLVLDKALPVEVRVPEAGDRIRNLRVDAVIVGQHPVCLGGGLLKEGLHALDMPRKPTALHPVQIRFHVGRELPDGLLDAVEIVIKIPLPRLAQEKEKLVGFSVLRPPNEQHAQHRDAGHGDDNREDRQQCHFCT